jgi:predicted transcriptional regulator
MMTKKVKQTGVHSAIYRKNDALIRAEYTRVLKATHKMPTQAEVGKECGITEKTVNTHLHAISFNDIIKPWKLFGSDVLKGLKEKAESGDAAAVRLYMFLVYDKVERKEIKAEVAATVKGKLDVKVKVPSKIAKLIGDALAKDE